MSKVFSNKPISALESVKWDNISANLDVTLSEFNGGLDSNNLPVLSVTDVKLVEPARTNVIVGAVSGFSVQMPSQSYHITRRSSVYEDSTDIWTPLFETDLDSDTWSAGFNRLVDLDSNFLLAPLSFDAKEGILVGCATVDWEHGNQVFQVQVSESPSTFAPRGRGNEWWTEWGLFVNNILVAKSGQIYPRRHTTQIPFAIAVGSQPIVIELRVKINTWYVAGAPVAGETESTPFKVFSTTIWARNHYR
jgi:hypothetical protein